jgi:hypothetical protein
MQTRVEIVDASAGPWTVRAHFNPCFWTAYWNPRYYAAALTHQGPSLKPREQLVYSLNIRANKVLLDKTENIHFEKRLSRARLNTAHVVAHAERLSPELVPHLKRRTFELDCENLFTALEADPCYGVLRAIISRQVPLDLREKEDLALFLIVHTLRGHALLTSIARASAGSPRGGSLEALIALRQALTDRHLLSPLMHIIISGKWVFYAMAADTFPLTDSPVLTSPTTIMIALSPRLMLEVYRYLRSPKPWEVRRSIKPSKLAEFRRRTIANASKEIIFSERGLLDSWRSLPEFQRQRTLLDREKTAAPYSLIKTDPAFFASQ